MKHLIIYAHPNPKSFNHAVKEIVEEKLRAAGQEVEVRDLYAMGFDAVLKGSDFISFKQGKTPPDIQREQEYIRKAGTLIFIHPVWWFSMPAILKGYIDRVFSHGFAYATTGESLKGLLSDKKAMIFNTTGGSEETYESFGFADALKKTMETGTFGVCGMEVVLHKYFHAVPFVSDEVRKKMLDELRGMKL